MYKWRCVLLHSALHESSVQSNKSSILALVQAQGKIHKKCSKFASFLISVGELSKKVSVFENARRK